MLKTKPQIKITIAPAKPEQEARTESLNLGRLKEILATIQEIKKHRPELFQS